MSRSLPRTLAALVLLAGCADVAPPTAPDAVALDPDSTLPQGDGITGAWTRTGYAVTGTATLTIDGTAAQLVLSSDFSIGQAPGPTLYLNTDGNPNRGRPLRIGALQRRTGAQSYAFNVPEGVRYTHIIIWCDPFNVPMAEVRLPPAGG